MFVIEVIPLHSGPGIGLLSYFSSVPYERGTIISIPIRSRDTDAVVLSVLPVSALKTALRAATFTLRKLPAQPVKGTLSDTFLALVDEVALLRALLPSDVLTTLIPKKHFTLSYTKKPSDVAPGDHRVLLFTAQQKTRVDEYKKIIRESFALNHSVLFVAPTLHGVEIAERELTVGIEEYSVVLTGEKKAAVRGTRMERLSREHHPILVIATPTYAYLERPDIGTVIIENARAKGYKSLRRPYLDHVATIMTHARLTGRSVILGDLVPCAEHVHHLRERHYLPYGEYPKRLDLPGKLSVLHQKKDNDGNEPFKLFSNELLEGIESTMRKRGRVFLFCARRGLSPVVGCADCGHILRDPESGAPLSLFRTASDGKEERWLVSATSGYRAPMRDVCPNCSSWRLRERGIGIQHVETELRKVLPNVPVTLFDHTTATTHGKAKKIAEIFYGIHSHVMLGTGLAIPYLSTPIDMSGIVSMDSLLSLPSWRQQEEVFATLLLLREKTKGTVWVQTRHRPDDRILTLATRAELSVFYDEELDVRRSFSYPPFSVFILLSYQGTKNAIESTEAMLASLFSQYGIAFYGLPPESDAHVLRRGFLRFPRESWPDERVVDALRTLPPSIKIEFDPERII